MTLTYDYKKATPRPTLSLNFCSKDFETLYDTGSNVSLLSLEAFRQIPLSQRPSKIPFNHQATNVSGDKLTFYGCYAMNVTFQGLTLNHPVFVVKSLGSKHQALIGMDIICRFPLYHNVLSNKISLAGDSSLKFNQKYGISTKRTRIEPFTSQAINVKIQDTLGSSVKLEELYFQIRPEMCPSIRADDALIKTNEVGVATIYLTNAGLHPIEIPRNLKIGNVAKMPPSSHIKLLDDVLQIANIELKPSQSSHQYKKDFEWLKSKVKLTHLTPDQQESFLHLLCKNIDCISRHPHDLGKCKILTTRLELDDPSSAPFWVKQFPIAEAHREYLLQCIEEWKRIGLIEASDSNYNSPIFCVYKRPDPCPNHAMPCHCSNEKPVFRPVVDFRRLNSKLKLPNYQLPTIKEILDDIGRFQPTVFAKIDLTKGFWQVEVEEKSRDLLSFMLPGQHQQYRYCRSAMGINQLPLTFQKMVDKVLLPLRPRAINYIDDILLMGKSFSDLQTTVQDCFNCLRKAGLKIRLEKSEFFVTQTTFLGYSLTPNSYTTNKSNIEAIASLPLPRSLRDIKSALGMANFYHHLLPRFSTLIAPLSNLLKKDSNYTGGLLPSSAAKAFNELKKLLTNSPVLSYLQPEGELRLYSDASESGLAGACFQVQNNVLKPIGFCSRTLKKSEHNYSIFAKELKAAEWSISYFHHYLHGRPFKLFVDNKPLEKSATKTEVKTLNRLQQLLLDYNFTVHRISSKDNPVDLLSRCALECNALLGKNKSPFLAIEDIKNLQKTCPICQVLTTYVKTKQRPSNPVYKTVVSKYGPSCFLHDDVLYIKVLGFLEPLQIAPASLHAEIIQTAHSACGHGRTWKTLKLIQQQYTWPGIEGDVQRALDECIFCCKTAGPNQRPNVPLGALPKADYPFARVHMDHFGRLKTVSGFSYIICIIDEFSRYANFYCTKTKSASETAQIFVDNWCSKFQIPEVVVTDRDAGFLSELNKKVFELLQIRKQATSSFHAASNSRSEYVWKHVTKHIRAFLDDGDDNWPTLVPMLSWTWNSRVNTSTESSPHQLLFGVPVKYGPFDPCVKLRHFYGDDFSSQLANRIKKIRTIASQLNEEYTEKYTDYYNSKVRPQDLKEGSLCYLFTPQNSKLKTRWSFPWLLTKKVTPWNAHIQHVYTLKTQYVHMNRLKPFKGNIPAEMPTKKVTDSSAFSDSEEQSATPKSASQTRSQNLFYDAGDIVVLNPQNFETHRPLPLKRDMPSPPSSVSPTPAAIKQEPSSPLPTLEDISDFATQITTPPSRGMSKSPIQYLRKKLSNRPSLPTLEDISDFAAHPSGSTSPPSQRLTRRQAADRNIVVAEEPLPSRQDTKWYSTNR